MATSTKIGTSQLLFNSADTMGMEPKWITPLGLFTINTKDGQKHIFSTNSALNSHLGMSLARNKYFARRVLASHSLPNIPFTKAKTVAEATTFLALHRTIIAKPICGSGSRDIHIIDSAEQISALDVKKYIFEKYIAGQEFRYLMLNGEVIAVHESDYGTSVQADRPLKRISYEESTWSPELVAMSQQIVKAVGLGFAAVDFMVDENGKAYILEVNGAPGIRWFHTPTSGPIVDVAGLYLKAILEA